jgi:peptidoglycan/LPS O-acetylase OafA/YrhL
MGTNGPGNPIVWVVLALVAASVVLFVIGMLLHRSGTLGSRGAAAAWGVLTILPLFGGGILLFS